MVTQGLARGWIKGQGHEKDENNHGVHATRTQPQRVHITSRTLRSNHAHFNLPTQSHFQLLMLFTIKFPLTIVSTTSVSMFTPTLSATQALHSFCDGTAISLTETRLSLSTPFYHGATPALATIFWRSRPTSLLSFSIFCSSSLPSKIVLGSFCTQIQNSISFLVVLSEDVLHNISSSLFGGGRSSFPPREQSSFRASFLIF